MRPRAARAADAELQPRELIGPVFIAGMGRTGRTLADALTEFDIGYAAIERDQRLREAVGGYNVAFGDLSDPHLGAGRASRAQGRSDRAGLRGLARLEPGGDRQRFPAKRGSPWFATGGGGTVQVDRAAAGHRSQRAAGLDLAAFVLGELGVDPTGSARGCAGSRRRALGCASSGGMSGAVAGPCDAGVAAAALPQSNPHPRAPSPPRSSARASPSSTARSSTSRFRRSRAISAPAPPSCPGRSTPISCRSALILLGGGAGDHFGRRRLFLVGLAIFTVASLLCAAAPALPWLLAGRGLQGLGGAPLCRTASRSSAPRSPARRGDGRSAPGRRPGRWRGRSARLSAGLARHDRLADDLPSQPADRRGCRLLAWAYVPRPRTGAGRCRSTGRARCWRRCHSPS